MPTPYDQMTRDELVAALTALQRAVQAGAPGAHPQSLAETERLAHELHVHQIELEMQNRELREAQQALEDSRDRYAQLYDFAPVGYLTLDRAQCIAEINLTGAGLLGTERARLIGQPFAHYVVAADRPILVQHLARCSQTSGLLVSEITIQGRNGALVRVQLSSIGTADTGTGAPQCAISLTDISARVHAQRELQASEARYRTVSELISDLVFALRITDAGELAYEWHAGTIPAITGYTLAELLRQQIWQRLIATEDLPQVQQRLSALLQGQAQAIELRVITTDGVTHWLRLHAYAEPDAATGRVARIIGAIKDITEYKHAGELVRFQARLLDAVAQTVVATDVDDRITYWNQAAEHAHGWPAEEVVGDSLRDRMITATAREQFASILRQAHAGTPWFGEIAAQRRDGSVFPCLLICAPIVEDQTITGLVVVASDLTERKALEHKLLETQKLESLGVLAGGIAHDFNNLLAIIIGNAGLARSDLPADSPARESVIQIEAAAHRAADLTRQMLAYAGKGRFVMQSLDLTDLVHDTMVLLEASVGKSVHIQYQLASDLPAVLADATQLRQVVMNLMINASEAIGEQEGIVTLTTTARQMLAEELTRYRFGSECTPGMFVNLEIADTGGGMDAETQERIFDPFFTTKFTGRGLGLAAVLGIVQRHQGALRVESAPEHGTTFRILLPAVVAPADRVLPDPAPTQAWRGSGTVLVVDDEAGVRRLAAQLLDRLGFTVLLADDGRAGIEVLEAHRTEITCVLLDLTMPKLGGVPAFRALRQIAPHIPIALMSGYSADEALQRFAEQGLAGFIQKPFTSEAFERLLRQILTRQPGAGSAVQPC